MAKYLDLSKSVHDLAKQYPEFIDIMVDLGFRDISKPAALNSVGRVMTVPKGVAIKGIPLDQVIQAFEAAGFSVGEGPEALAEDSTQPSMSQQVPHSPAPARKSTDEELDEEGRTKLLQSYVARLSAGENLETVRTDFVAHFKDVDAAEIARAEQALIESGTKIDDVQRLCDVHSALFHGATREEKIQNAEAAVMNSLAAGASEGDFKTKVLINIPGHPVRVLTLENQALAQVLEAAKAALGTPEERMALAHFMPVGIHYAKKGDLVYPILKVKHGYSGPSDVMWGVDDEIRAELRSLMSAPTIDDEWRKRAKAVLTRADEMIYKETNILLPLCVKQFSDEEWLQMYADMKGYDLCLIEDVGVWQTGEAFVAQQEQEALSSTGVRSQAQLRTSDTKTQPESKDDQEAAQRGSVEQMSSADTLIQFPSGSMSVHQLNALLNTIPLEITFVDDQNINRYWNDDGKKKLFKRPPSALYREVWHCHPPKIQKMVKGVIATLRSGKEDSVDIWMEKEGEPVLVRYMAVRDHESRYLGTMEIIQRMNFAKKHFLGED